MPITLAACPIDTLNFIHLPSIYIFVKVKTLRLKFVSESCVCAKLTSNTHIVMSKLAYVLHYITTQVSIYTFMIKKKFTDCFNSRSWSGRYPCYETLYIRDDMPVWCCLVSVHTTTYTTCPSASLPCIPHTPCYTVIIPLMNDTRCCLPTAIQQLKTAPSRQPAPYVIDNHRTTQQTPPAAHNIQPSTFTFT